MKKTTAITISFEVGTLSKPLISCQKCKSKNLNLKFIYRIFYKNAKKVKPKNEIHLSDIRKHNLTVFSKGKDIFLLTYVGQIMSR
jgi:hypothetical protein